MTTTSWYRRSVWNYKGNREYTKSGYEVAKERFNPDDLDVDCSDRHYVITGSNSGIGLEITREVAKRGGVLHMVCRNFDAAKAVRSDIITNTGNDKIHIHTLDLARPREVMKWAQNFAATHEKIHVLVNNAGCMIHERLVDEDDIEANFAVNTLSVHIITMTLMPVLQKNEDARVITVSSAGMLVVRLDPIDLMHEDMEPFNGNLVYSQNKRQQVVMTLWYAQRFDKVHFSAMHPGWADTPAVRNAMPQFYEMMKENLRTPSEGADTAVWLAISKAALKYPSGFFYQDREPVSTHLPLAWTKTSIEEENLFMQKLMLLMQKISYIVNPEQTESNGVNNSETNGHIVSNGVKAALESSETNTNTVEELNGSLKAVSLKEEIEGDQTEKPSQVPVEDVKSEEQNSDTQQTEETPSSEVGQMSPDREESAKVPLDDSGIDATEPEVGEKPDEVVMEKTDSPSLANEETGAQIEEENEKPASPSSHPEEQQIPTTDSPTPDENEESEPAPPTPDENEELKSETTPPEEREEPEAEATTEEQEPEATTDATEEEGEPEAETEENAEIASTNTDDEPKPVTPAHSETEKPEEETPPSETPVPGTPKTAESNKETKESEPETPQPDEKDETGTDELEEKDQNDGTLLSENQDSAQRPNTSESNADNADSTPSPTPTDQTYNSAASVVEHLIDVTAARASDPNQS